MTSENAMTTKVLTTTADILVLLDELFMSGNPSKQMIELLERWRASYPLDGSVSSLLVKYKNTCYTHMMLALVDKKPTILSQL
jgi:hypothetical protein